MLSLKQLFWLMGSVSALMIAALVYTKLNHPQYVSFGEVRAIDRLCQRYADDIMSKLASEQGAEDERRFLHDLHDCLAACRSYLVSSRAKSASLGDPSMKSAQIEVPACLLPSPQKNTSPTQAQEPTP